MMLWASHVAESLRDSEETLLHCGVSLGEADLRGGVQPGEAIVDDHEFLRSRYYVLFAEE